MKFGHIILPLTFYYSFDDITNSYDMISPVKLKTLERLKDPFSISGHIQYYYVYCIKETIFSVANE